MIRRDPAIRLTAPSDWDALARLFDELDRLHSDTLPWLFQLRESSPRDREFFGRLTSDAQAAVFVADAGEVVGFVHVVLRRTPDLPIFVPHTRASVESVFVSPDCRRRGVARALLHAAELWAEERGAQGLDLNVYEFNHRAQEFFESLGYSTLSRRMSKRLRP